MIKKQILKTVITTFFLLFSSGFVCAQTPNQYKNQGYLLDNVGSSAAIQAPTAGVCVRTTEWTPARAITECDPELITKPAPPKPVVAAAPAPKPVTPPKPQPALKPVVQKFSLSADALFDFDKSALRPAGMKKLDDVVTALKGSQYDSIVATGHTDRLGGVDYNQRLSHRRAEAVRQYLVDKGLDGSRIKAVGKGKSQPHTKAADCKGKGGRALHACLQPDRRVDLEVSGSKTVNGTSISGPSGSVNTGGKSSSK